MSIIVFLTLFLIYTLIGQSFFPVDPETNVLIAPDWYPFLGLAVTVIPTIIFSKLRKRQKEKSKRKSKIGTPIESFSHTICKGSSEIVEPQIPFHKEYQCTLQSTQVCTNIDIPKIIKEEDNWRREQRGLSSIENELYKIDTMDGHAFEFWCANLLRHNGFYDVVVTPGSNDQGVDITAKKEEVHYAIQCKCFSSDLGNKSIQEVYAGKEMYNCQVAAVMTNQHFTNGAKLLAEKTRVLLWGREKIIELLRNQE